MSLSFFPKTLTARYVWISPDACGCFCSAVYSGSIWTTAPWREHSRESCMGTPWLSVCRRRFFINPKVWNPMPWQKIYIYIWFVYLFIMVENNMPILRIAVFLRWDDHPQYGEWIDPITHMKHPSSTLTPRRWWVPHFGSTLRHANGHHPRCIGSSGCSVAGKHGDAFVDLTTSDETKMGGKEIKDEITPNEFINQHGLF